MPANITPIQYNYWKQELQQQLVEVQGGDVDSKGCICRNCEKDFFKNTEYGGSNQKREKSVQYQTVQIKNRVALQQIFALLMQQPILISSFAMHITGNYIA